MIILHVRWYKRQNERKKQEEKQLSSEQVENQRNGILDNIIIIAESEPAGEPAS